MTAKYDMSTFSQGWWSCFKHVVNNAQLSDEQLIDLLDKAGFNSLEAKFYRDSLDNSEIVDESYIRMLGILDAYIDKKKYQPCRSLN